MLLLFDCLRSNGPISTSLLKNSDTKQPIGCQPSETGFENNYPSQRVARGEKKPARMWGKWSLHLDRSQIPEPWKTESTGFIPIQYLLGFLVTLFDAVIGDQAVSHFTFPLRLLQQSSSLLSSTARRTPTIDRWVSTANHPSPRRSTPKKLPRFSLHVATVD